MSEFVYVLIQKDGHDKSIFMIVHSEWLANQLVAHVKELIALNSGALDCDVNMEGFVLKAGTDDIVLEKHPVIGPKQAKGGDA